MLNGGRKAMCELDNPPEWLFLFIKSNSPLAATQVMTGLQQLNSIEANASLLKVPDPHTDRRTDTYTAQNTHKHHTYAHIE
jgi:hypothetical protein